MKIITNLKNKYNIFLLIIFFYYVIVISSNSILKHLIFWTQAFDLGIFDQGIWLASKFQNLFITVRGLHKFGDHFDPIIYLLGIFYWIYDNVSIMLFIHTLGIASGVFPLYKITKDKTRNEILALLVAFAYLCYPALINMNLDVIHPEAFATTFTIYAFYFILKNNYINYAIFSILALLCKEDICITYFFFGIYIFFSKNKIIGIITSLISIIWLFLCMKVFIPYFNNSDFFRFRAGWFSEFYQNKFDFFWYLRTIFKLKNLIYIVLLLLPVMFIPLLEFKIFLIGVPAILINILSNVDYLRSINYHYNSMVIPFIFYSLIFGLSKIRYMVFRLNLELKLKKIIDFNFFNILISKNNILKINILFIFVLTIIFSNIPLASSDIITTIPYNFMMLNYYLKKDRKPYIINQALKMIPKNAKVSADYFIVPHLTHRKFIYMFPNPFVSENWAIQDENPHNPESIEYIIVDKYLINPKYALMLDKMVNQNKISLIFNKESNSLKEFDEKKFELILKKANEKDKIFLLNSYIKNDRKYILKNQDDYTLYNILHKILIKYEKNIIKFNICLYKKN